MFTLKFETSNAEFHDQRAVADVLERVAENARIRIEEGAGGLPVDGTIMDVNGNSIGEWTYDPEPFDHDVIIAVKVRMTEMDDANPEASAEIALGLVEETLSETLAGFESAEVIAYGEAYNESPEEEA